MSYPNLPKRVFNSPLIKCANFKDGSNINLIKLTKPYANGDCYAVHETTKCIFCSNGMFKDRKSAENKFNLMVKNNQSVSELLEVIETGN